MIRSLPAFALLLLLTSPSFAQTIPTRAAKTPGTELRAAAGPSSPSYGMAGDATVNVHAFSFTGYDSTTVVAGDGLGHRYVQSGVPELNVGISLPNGALITSIELQGCDENPAAQMTLNLIRSNVSTPYDLLASVTSVPGCAWSGFATSAVELDPLYTVNNRDTSLAFTLGFGATDGTLKFTAARVYYRLQMGPAPATQSFVDVSPSQVAIYRAVENLKASGITTGCGDGTNFCPNENVTRGQMALFFARALGLHWPF